MVSVLKFHSLDIICIMFLTHIYYLLISSSFTRMLTYSKLKYIINYCSFMCDLPKYACHYMIINCTFLKNNGIYALLMKNANTLLAITNLFSVMTSDY